MDHRRDRNHNAGGQTRNVASEDAGQKRALESEVDRYYVWPGQALAYMIGQLEIQGWRDAAERLRGSAFDVREFHDRLLGLGSLPLPALRREMGADPSPS